MSNDTNLAFNVYCRQHLLFYTISTLFPVVLAHNSTGTGIYPVGRCIVTGVEITSDCLVIIRKVVCHRHQNGFDSLSQLFDKFNVHCGLFNRHAPE